LISLTSLMILMTMFQVSFIKRPVPVKKDQHVRVLCAHNDDDIWFPLLFTEDEEEEDENGGKGVVSVGAPPMPTGETGLHDMYDSSRMWSFTVIPLPPPLYPTYIAAFIPTITPRVLRF
jgi:hypothetical protein